MEYNPPATSVYPSQSAVYPSQSLTVGARCGIGFRYCKLNLTCFRTCEPNCLELEDRVMHKLVWWDRTWMRKRYNSQIYLKNEVKRKFILAFKICSKADKRELFTIAKKQKNALYPVIMIRVLLLYFNLLVNGKVIYLSFIIIPCRLNLLFLFN